VRSTWPERIGKGPAEIRSERGIEVALLVLMFKGGITSANKGPLVLFPTVSSCLEEGFSAEISGEPT
jgi:hypothetical protein